ncbi:MAG: RnfABCDGE type electron transport complex subunit B [Legionellales bacterium]|nr:RnfABCDGE type electron transport complex subunit B [Legionellales bacterium]
MINLIANNNRPLSKLAAESQKQGAPEHRTGAYTPVCEDSSTGATQLLTSAVEFRKRSIDALLPQTQCGLCGYGGCMPYAKAIAEQGEAINRCPPGGMLVLNKLANLLEQAPIPLISPPKQAQIAFVREEECIGCMKCINACPVDAIVGAPKLMHTIIADACTGCELCVPPCPVDCIEMHVIPEVADEAAFYKKANQAREAFHGRNKRLEEEEQEKQQTATLQHAALTVADENMAARKAFIAEAIARAKAKKGV